MTVNPTPIAARLIRPGDNDRKVFDRAALEDLARSIDRQGLVYPPTIRPAPRDAEGHAFEIVCGERRFRAMTEVLGWTEIPAFVRELTDAEAASVMLLENTARADLSPLEEAAAYQARIDIYGITEEEVAEIAGKRVSHVRNRLALLRLSPEMREALSKGVLTVGYAQVLADSTLDNNLQMVAFQRLRENPSPTMLWWRGQVGELETAAQQENLFDGDFGDEGVTQLTDWQPPEEPGLPGQDDPPEFTGPPAEVLRRQAEWWREQGHRWLAGWGKKREAARCNDRADALDSAAEVVGESLHPANEDETALTTLRRFSHALSDEGVAEQAVVAALNRLAA